MKQNFYLPAEWEEQSGIQLTWPHSGTDWAHMLKEVQSCFIEIAKEISKREKLLIVAPDVENVKKQICKKINTDNIRFFECETNDTWARDHGGISILDKNGNAGIIDFKFNGWGLKFAANKDNLITGKIFQSQLFNAQYINCLNSLSKEDLSNRTEKELCSLQANACYLLTATEHGTKIR